MKRTLCIVAFVAAVICGCVPSIHGIATRDNKVWDEQLLGIWGEPNDPNRTEMWRFDKADEDKMYGLIYIDDRGKVGRFDVALVKVGELRFLDVYPKELDDQMNGFYKGHWVPAHTFVKVDGISDELHIRMMDPDKVKKMLTAKPDLVKHEMVDGEVLLTAGAAELQKFVSTYSSEIWADEMVMVRKKF